MRRRRVGAEESSTFHGALALRCSAQFSAGRCRSSLADSRKDIVYHGRRADFAPLYDLVSTSVYPELSQEMAMRIGGDAAFDSISRDSFSRMAEECAVAPKLVLGRLDNIAKRIVPAASRLADECNG